MLLGVVVIIIVAAASGSKKKKAAVINYYPESSNSSIHDEKTEYIGAKGASEINFLDADFSIKISCASDMSKTWNLPVKGELIIGRAQHAHVMLDDGSVAREQCKIVIDGANLAVVNLSNTNKTILNGNRISGMVPLQSGDTLTLGRDVLRVDYIQSLTAPQPSHEQPTSVNRSSNTESIF